MAKYTLTNKAVKDLSDIWNYTCETWSGKQADKYYAMLMDCCKALATQPEKGKKYDEVSQRLLGQKVNQHIIFYQVESEREILVVRILHSRMDIKRRIRD